MPPHRPIRRQVTPLQPPPHILPIRNVSPQTMGSLGLLSKSHPFPWRGPAINLSRLQTPTFPFVTLTNFGSTTTTVLTSLHILFRKMVIFHLKDEMSFMLREPRVSLMPCKSGQRETLRFPRVKGSAPQYGETQLPYTHRHPGSPQSVSEKDAHGS